MLEQPTSKIYTANKLKMITFFSDMYRGDAISISELSLDVASSGIVSDQTSETPSTEELAPAVGVEECIACDEKWTGESCQRNINSQLFNKVIWDFVRGYGISLGEGIYYHSQIKHQTPAILLPLLTHHISYTIRPCQKSFRLTPKLTPNL